MKTFNEFYKVSAKYNKPSGLLKGFFNMNLDKTLKGKDAIELVQAQEMMQNF